MEITKEQTHWDRWNIGESDRGLMPDRVALRDAVISELRSIGLPRGRSVLEIACGVGWVGEQIHREFEYLGLDFAPTAIEKALARVPGARFQTADFLEWPAPQAAYDAILCIDAVAYFRDQDEAIAKMHHALKPGGWLVITTLNPMIYSRMRWVGPPGEGQVRKWLTRAQFHSLLGRNGFDLKRSRSIEPGGDMGLLRVLNARKVHGLLSIVLGKGGWKRLLENVGLGQYRVVLAQRRECWQRS